MKILHVAHLLPYPPASGVAIRTYHLARLLAARARVDYLCRVQEGILKDVGLDESKRRFAQETGVTVTGAFPLPEAGNASKAWTMARAHLSGRPYESAWLADRRFREEIRSRQQTGDYDAIFVETVGLWPLLGSSAAPVVVGHHNVESDLAERRASRSPGAVGWLLGREASLILRLERRAAQATPFHVVPSRKDGDLFQSVTGSTAAPWVVPSGVDTGHFAPSAAPFDRRGRDVLFIGSLGWHPNRDAVQRLGREVAPRLAEILGRPVRATVVGRTDGFAADVRALAGLALEFTGFVDDPRVHMADAKVFVAPLSYGGGTKLKVLCAMACGLPVVTTEFGAEGLDVGPEDGIFVCDDSAAIAERTAALLRDPAAWERAGRAARAAMERRYDWKRVGESVGDLLEAVTRTTRDGGPRAADSAGVAARVR